MHDRTDSHAYTPPRLSSQTTTTASMTGKDEEAHSSYRSGARAFLPVSEEASVSTRGQNLPGLIRTLSFSAGAGNTPRRNASFRFLSNWNGEEHEAPRRGSSSQRRGSDSSTGEDGMTFERRPTLLPDEGGRRMSSAAITLLTPQMRSQRLIGNSNPRYKW